MYEFLLFFGGVASYKFLSYLLHIKRDLSFFLRTYKLILKMTVFLLKATVDLAEQQKEFYTKTGVSEANTELLVNLTETAVLHVYSGLEKSLYDLPPEYQAIARKVILSDDYAKYILEAGVKLGGQTILYNAIIEMENHEQTK
tara:strand:+ start:10036 stop:10464 length:429 start_codon:yes stop_codon:yes gene_type:complete